jgi:ribonuclease HI
MTKSYPTVTIYTDGSCHINPGPGGWGCLLHFHDGRTQEMSGGEAHTTNNRMELTAALIALRALAEPHTVELYTDSQYFRDGITRWLPGWQKRGWMTADRRPVKNKDLWEALAEEVKRHQVHWHWVKGHAGQPGNERANDLAQRQMKKALHTKPLP